MCVRVFTRTKKNYLNTARLSPPGAAGVERAGCSVGPGAGPGGAVPPSPRLGPRPSALGCLHHRLRPQDGLRNLSTENDKLGTSAPVTLRRLRCFYTVPDSGTSSQRSIRQHDGFSGGRKWKQARVDKRELTKEALKGSHRQWGESLNSVLFRKKSREMNVELWGGLSEASGEGRGGGGGGGGGGGYYWEIYWNKLYCRFKIYATPL